MIELEARLQALRRRFIDQAAADAIAIERHAAAGEWPAVRDLGHGLAGRAGMFGFPLITDAARALEEAVEAGAAPALLRPLAAALIAKLNELRA
ncbi:HPt (histidine-containing phosphotransfer) domain-containing protein [Sphingomonas naasensis]|uniref:HPt domain-containing protein n=1 Tax=Sphingomonas naasensis TaxID=1344951 RepID=A0A4V3QXC5_9SPHN|nr:Hpt domain-containing protein [Sphingomonas naasensis]NIJ18672.1 HPt (histidine-containing phosphotransfer) domain-containing protein [Sphingomonas naasensis]TGX45912.1 hypothetical protein E5A74_01690 [Sphingomonas naasensis]